MKNFRRWKAALLAAAIMVTAVPFGTQTKVYAEEEIAAEGAEGEGLEGEGLEGESLEGELPAEESVSTVTPGTILANNGLYIANTFPDSMLPDGFHRVTVAYEGQGIDLASMDTNNLVNLAYLTDATGTVGDFYLCDTATAMMSDFVKFDGGNGKFLIVLDPGDNVNPPAGFTKANLNVNGKTVIAWTLPTGESSEEEKKEGAAFRLTEQVYAAGLDIGAGAAGGSGEESPAEASAAVPEGEPSSEPVPDGGNDAAAAEAAAAAAAEVAAAAVETDGSGFIKARPADFFLVYGIDQSGLQGFYLYDTLGQTYQRYLEIDTGESEATAKYRKSAQIRLFIIAGLIVFAVVLLFIIVNMALSGRKGGRSDDDDDDDVEAMKKRVRTKEKKALKKNGRRFISSHDDDDEYDDEDDDDDDDDGYDDDEEDDVRYYRKSDLRTGRGVRSSAQDYGYRQDRRTADDRDWEEESTPADRGRYGGHSGYGDQGGYADQSRYQDGGQDIDLDDDFNFDFIKPRK